VSSKAEVIGIDHVYVTVSDLRASEVFYDRVMIEALGFRKNHFTLAGDPHVQYFNRHLASCCGRRAYPSGTSHTRQACITSACA
jgi:catechol 2,3-dioxygenase-like lactoylglutathione lyase family enzyme